MFADFFAGKAADAGEIPEELVRRTLHADDIAYLVLCRLLSVQRECLKISALQERCNRLSAQGHSVLVRPSILKCSLCHRSFQR
eukprot:9466195-Pyramimonas_sp.AAC.1